MREPARALPKRRQPEVPPTTNIVKLDIGGTVFKTTKSTLTKYDGFFKTMLETNVPLAKDESGAIFIDRSPKHFDLILNFLRDGNAEFPKSESALKEIYTEADYYQLPDLSIKCAGLMGKERVENGVNVLNTDGELFQVITDPKKPVLIIYYQVDFLGRSVKPDGFDIKRFLERYYSLDIYFKSFKIDSDELPVGNPTGWRWSLHSKTETVYGSPKIDYTRKNVIAFQTQLDQAIQALSARLGCLL